MIGTSVPPKPQPSLKTSSRSGHSGTIHVVMLIDAWFPSNSKRPGVYGGGQVHVRALRHNLKKYHDCKVELFYSAHPNIIIRACWSFWIVVRLLQFSKRKKIDIIHSHGYNSGLSAKLAAFFLKKPVVHTVHGSTMLDRGLNSPKGLLENWLLTKIKYAAQISVSSNFLKHKNINKNIHIIPNGVNISAFNEVTAQKNEEPTLIWVGRTDPVKGLDILKEAIKKVRRKIPNLQTELVTGGRLKGKSLIRAYKRSHVFVLPSLAEGQPITLLEAWAAKLPVVVTKVGDNPTMVVDGVNGYLVEPGNVQQLAHAVITILRSKTKKDKMGLAGFELVKSNYTWKKVAAQTFKVYQSLLK